MTDIGKRFLGSRFQINLSLNTLEQRYEINSAIKPRDEEMREKGQVYHHHHPQQQQLHTFPHPHNRQAPPLPPPPHLHQHHATLAHHMRSYMNMPDLLAMGIQGERWALGWTCGILPLLLPCLLNNLHDVRRRRPRWPAAPPRREIAVAAEGRRLRRDGRRRRHRRRRSQRRRTQFGRRGAGKYSAVVRSGRSVMVLQKVGWNLGESRQT